MLDLALILVLLILGIRAFMALSRESAVRREFGQSSSLDALVLLYPIGPIGVLFGPLLLPRIVVLVLVGAFFVGVFFVASKQRIALECSGTDRVKGALSATSMASLGALVGAIYVALASTFMLAGHYIGSTSVGA